jgi:hypothetical protein
MNKFKILLCLMALMPKLYAQSDTVYHQAVYPIGTLTPDITESSGLIYDNGYVWSHNDAGNGPEIYKIAPGSGKIIQTLIVTNYPNIDWEDIACDSTYFYIGDIGNNDGIRTDLKVLRISKAQFMGSSAKNVNVTAEAIAFSYTDQTPASSKNNYNCEALTSMGDSLYIFTKDKGDFKTRVYQLAKIPGTYIISPYDTYDAKGLITGADFNPKTKELVLLGYGNGHTNSFICYFSGVKGNKFFSGNSRRVEIGGTNDWQMEGICFKGNDSLFLSCETSYVPATLYDAAFYDIKTGISSISQPLPVRFEQTGAGIYIHSEQRIKEVSIISAGGKLLLKQETNANDFLIRRELSGSAGIYIIEVKYQNGLICHSFYNGIK